MKRIAQDIKDNNFQKVYLLCGEETYLRNQYRDNLMNALTTEGDTMNVVRCQGKDFSANEIIDFAETMPFLADRRVILVEDSGVFATKGAGEELASYIPRMPDTACIIFSEEDVNKSLKLYKTVSSEGYVAEFKRQSSQDLHKWVASRLKKEGFGITSQALDEFLQCTGDDMMMIQSELEKLISYVYGKDGVNLEDVHAVCRPKVEDKIFDMLDHIMYGRCEKAMELYGDLLSLRETPQHIMYMLERQIRNSIFIRDLKRESKSVNEMSSILGLKSFAVNKMMQQGERIGSTRLKEWLNLCAQTDADSRVGKIDAQIGTELAIIHMANQAKL